MFREAKVMYHNFPGVQIAYFFYMLMVSYATSRFHNRVLTPRKQLRHPIADCLILMQLLLSVLSLTIDRPVFTSAWFMISHLLVPLILFQGRLTTRIAAFIIVYVSYTFIELMPASVFLFLNILFPGMDLQPKNLMLSGNIPCSVAYFLSVALFYFIFLNILSDLFRRQFAFMKIKSLLLISLPFFIVLITTFLLEPLPNVHTFFLMTPVAAAPFLLSQFLLSRGFSVLKRQEELLLKKENEKKRLEQQIDYYKSLDEEYRALRRWRHDTANHLSAIAYLLETKQYEKTKNYLENFFLHIEKKA